MVSTPSGIKLGEDAESAWSELAVANKCDVFKPSAKGFSGSCTSHGVVHLSWDPVNGADRYDVNYEADDTLTNPDPNTDSIRYEGPATEVYAQRWEGETYKFRVRARAKTGQQWSGWTDPVTVVCDPFHHRQLEPSGHDTDRSVSWTSPNSKFSAHSLGRHPYLHGTVQLVRHNPIHVRYMTDETKDLTLGRDNCSATQRNEEDDGWTRTCTIYWTEPIAIELDEDVVGELSHISGWIHQEDTAHIYLDAEGVLVSTPHRHCAGDGTCSDESDVPDLAWHPAMPDPDDDFWQNTLTDSGITALGGGIAGPVVAAALGLTIGAGIVVGVVVGFGVNVVYAWLSRDDDIVFIIDGYHGCLETSLSESNTWVQNELLSPIEETFEEGGYETVIRHEIVYCEQSQSAG